MADTLRMQVKQQSAGTALTEVGNPRKTLDLLKTQNQLDTLKVFDIEIEPVSPASTVKYRTGGLPLALTEGGVEITPGVTTPLDHYKFSALVAAQLGMAASSATMETAKIVSVIGTGQIKVGSDTYNAVYDATKDKLRLYKLADGAEAAAGADLVDEAAANILRIRVIYV